MNHDPAQPESPLPDRSLQQHRDYSDALAGVRHAIEQFTGCTDAEKAALTKELSDLESLSQKLEQGRVEIVLFGEIDTGKSALINALVGQAVASVDVRGGWTQEVWSTSWAGCGYCVPGLEQSQVVLLDTPGINEVDGAQRAAMAHDAARRADLILFVTDSDLNQTEFSALAQLAATHRPIILVLNKIDNYTAVQRAQLVEALGDSRLRGLVAPENIVLTAADPLPRDTWSKAPTGASGASFAGPRRKSRRSKPASSKCSTATANRCWRSTPRCTPPTKAIGSRPSRFACAMNGPRRSSGATRP